MRSSRRSPGQAFRHYLFNPVALGYLTVVAAVVVWVGIDLLFVDHQDASFSGVWAFLVTAPTSLLFVMLPGLLAWVGVVVGALVQAAVLGVVYRWFTDRSHHHPHTSKA
ncbi:SCO4225 family membrane protein [Streptomyces sp. NPDC059740]|uniref:SCO4225 family membrane protein n=1 Tax=Streptomyces sp. NPDC059740 TaxID=3346926 RepID=UPI0036642058